MNTRKTVRLLSVAALLVGLCSFAGPAVSANGCDPAYVTQSGDTFTVAPTGMDDTANLQCALDAAGAAGPGSTVQLLGDTYWTGLIEVNTFYGNFVGAGKQQTTITTLPDMPCPGNWPTLFQFLEGDIRIADLTFDISDPYPCQPWINPVDQNPMPREDLAVIVAIGGQPTDPSYDWSNFDTLYTSSSLENVNFHGAIDPAAPSYFGVTSGLYIGGPLSVLPGALGRARPMEGAHSVTNCSFKNAWQAIVTFDLSESSLVVGGSARQGNRFENVLLGLRSFDHDSTSVEFSQNEVVDVAPFGSGVVAQQTARPFFSGYPWSSPSQYLIRNNTIQVGGPADAISIVDRGPSYGEGTKVEAIVSQNRIHLEDGEWGGVWGYGADDVLVIGNRITGSGLAGIYFGFQDLSSSGWTIKGNNVQNLDADVAPIWLGVETSNCTVVGGSNKTNVLDEGTDNIVSGVGNMGGNPPGPEIYEAMQRRLEILSHFP